jgi:hypothetical protein
MAGFLLKNFFFIFSFVIRQAMGGQGFTEPIRSGLGKVQASINARNAIGNNNM